MLAPGPLLLRRSATLETVRRDRTAMPAHPPSIGRDLLLQQPRLLSFNSIFCSICWPSDFTAGEQVVECLSATKPDSLRSPQQIAARQPVQVRRQQRFEQFGLFADAAASDAVP